MKCLMKQLKESKSVIAALGSNVPSFITMNEKQKLDFYPREVTQKNSLIHTHILLVHLNN